MDDKTKEEKAVFTNKMIVPVFTDERGEIYDVLEEGDVEHIGMITFKEGVVRGNHYHLESTQYSLILDGKLKLTITDPDGGNKEEHMLEPGSFSSIPPMKVHTYEALTDARMMDFVTLSRNADGYEKDTVKL